jgi:small-conductance mechanosensitive channel
MHKQRLFMLIAAAIGMLACFLPWMNAPIVGSVAGTQGTDGYICLGLFLGAGAVALVGDRAKQLATRLGVGSSLLAASAMAIGVWKIVNVQSIIGHMDTSTPLVAALANSVSVGVGLYLIVVTGTAVPLLFGFMQQPAAPTRPSSSRKGPEVSQKARKKRRRDDQVEELSEETAEEVDVSPSAPRGLATKKKRLELEHRTG